MARRGQAAPVKWPQPGARKAAEARRGGWGPAGKGTPPDPPPFAPHRARGARAFRVPHSPAAAAAAGLLCAAGGFMGRLGPARAAEGPKRCWARKRCSRSRSRSRSRPRRGCSGPALALHAPALPAALARPRSRRAACSTVRTPALSPTAGTLPLCRLIAAGGGGPGRGREVCPSRHAGTPLSPRRRPRHAPAGEPQ